MIDLPLGSFGAILADPPWNFMGRSGEGSPEYTRRFQYPTMTTSEIARLPIRETSSTLCHLYLWVCAGNLRDGLDVMDAWGFRYKGHFVWVKTRRDGCVRGTPLGGHFGTSTELLLFGTNGRRFFRTWRPHNVIHAPTRGHSVKPDEQYEVIESCSEGPYLELFARRPRRGWTQWGNDPAIAPENSEVAA